MHKLSISTCECSTTDIKAVNKVLNANMLSTGPDTYKFQSKLATLYGKQYGVFVNSGQSALEIAIQATKIKLNKNILSILVPSTTYAASLWAIIKTNCLPVFCDIGSDYNIDFKNIDTNNINSSDVLLSVDLCGKKAQIPKKIKNNLFIIEDACEAVGNFSCNYGDIICLSFYPSHIITSGAGGMLLFNDKLLNDYIKSYISHGRVYGGTFTDHTQEWKDKFSFDKVGVSYRQNNFSAALGLSQLKRIKSIVKKRKINAMRLIGRYNKDNKIKKHFIFPSISYHKDCVFQFFPILIKNKLINRTKLLIFLFSKGIDTRVLLSLTNQPIIKKLFGNIENKYPFSKNVNNNGFIIGCHQELGYKEMDYIYDCLCEYADQS